jgi:enolase
VHQDLHTAFCVLRCDVLRCPLLLQVKIGMDVAASEFQTEDKMYDLKFKDKDNDGSGKKTG